MAVYLRSEPFCLAGVKKETGLMVETMTGHDRRQGLALAMCCGSMDCKIEVFIQLVFACR